MTTAGKSLILPFIDINPLQQTAATLKDTAMNLVIAYLPNGDELALQAETEQEVSALSSYRGEALDQFTLLTLCQVMLSYAILGKADGVLYDGETLAAEWLPSVVVEVPIKAQRDVKYTVEQIKKNVGEKREWAQRAIQTLYRHQTASEREAQQTTEHNNVGFNGVDAEILSSFAEQINRGRTLSPKQLAIAYKKLPKYAKQLYKIAYG